MQVKIQNWNIDYEVNGEGNPIILLHGWLCDRETMRPIANSLSQNFKVYLVDIVGFGKSDLPEHPLNTNDFGDFLAEFIKHHPSRESTPVRGEIHLQKLRRARPAAWHPCLGRRGTYRLPAQECGDMEYQLIC